ncbi:glycosyltransferase [Aurantiacibacter gangjinensis]|uniref:Glycosyl transferase family 1 n=1 Tax=Aurantiacibacter gangjinensis TaxID=502682 RepID=A0A0G9MN46_9SPHN|nr:glycosyltransferase [Aurantiacibacter gangjinensis]APE28228.1 glycosyl transferase, group 1 [Aurantiacibacter gangjinensis]KLE32126.1 glycosyl transferase family 1 [Aurantiacibacter gangjinensis]
MSATPKILHLHSTFDPGGKELRTVRLINEWGKEVDHAIVSGDLEKRGAAAMLGKKAKVSWPKFPSLQGKPTPGRLAKLGKAMAGYNLICTYNWGAIDAVMAHTIFADTYKLPPLVHHEDGFNEDEATRLKKRRNWYRKIALGRTAALVVPSAKLEDIALNVWDQPRTRVRHIPNGIDTRAYAAPPKRDILPRLIKHKDEFWIGSLAGLRPVKQLEQLVRAMESLPAEWQLVIAGEGPERDRLLAEAEKIGVEDRVHLPGFVPQPQKLVGLFDIFALSSQSEQFPISVVEAMSAGLPVAAPRVGDIGSMVSSENGPFLVDAGDEKALAASLAKLAADPAGRKRIGQANRQKARDEFDERKMIERYRALYWGLMQKYPKKG